MSAPSATVLVTQTELRSRFAARLSHLYGVEVPAYNTLLDVSRQVNERVLRQRGPSAERLGSIQRVTAERHGAIRVGSPEEMGQVARIFGALGMQACGFYDLRDSKPAPIPVVSTAFRPIDRRELAINPFRVFTSMLVPEDRRFFNPDLEKRLKNFIAARRLFPPALLELADRASTEGGLGAGDADRFLDLAAESFALSSDPVDRAWYDELERISSVAADIGGVSTTHINHLTPRVLDIDDLYAAMGDVGIEMIDRVQGPPRWEGPDVLLRQTSFKALSEPRLFRGPDGRVETGSLRVRFGEVEQRGIALTAAGRNLYDAMVRTVDERMTGRPVADREGVMVEVWRENLPTSELELCRQGLGHFSYRVDESILSRTRQSGSIADDLDALLANGVLVPEPLVYEDFLPRSAAGIFASNLTGEGSVDDSQGGAERTIGWMSDVVGADVHVPEEVYGLESATSLETAFREVRGA